MVQLAFDARQIPFAEPGLPVWVGRVPVQIVRSEIKPTSANDGQNMVVFHVRAIAGQYAGQENQIRLNLYNRSAQAVEIAQRQLSSIAHTVGRMTFQDTDALNGGQLLTVWVEQEREVTDQRTNQVRKLKSCQCNDFQLLDGRTIREAMSGAAASQPWSANEAAAQPAQGAAAQQQQFQPGPTAPAVQPSPAPGAFVPPGAGAPQSGFQPPPSSNGAPGAFAPSMGTPPGAPQYAPAPGGFQPPQAGQGMGTAAFPSSGAAGVPQGGFQPPGQGFAPPGQGMPPATPQGGFGAPGAFAPPGQQQQGYGQPQQGFAPPAGPQAGPGPWGPQ